jgi:hypothetical protein
MAVLCALLLVKALTGSDRTGLLAMALVAFDYFFVIGSSDGRMDAMCMALGFAGITAYIVLRETHLVSAILISQSCAAASGLTHPNGIIWFAGLWLLTLGLDRSRLRPGLLAAAALPYLAAAIGWGSFVAQDPHDFMTQFLGNVRESGNSNELSQHPLTDPLTALGIELTERYVQPFGLGVAALINRTKGIILAIYAGALIAALVSAKVRRSMAGRVLLCLAAVSFVSMTYVSGNKMYYYLIHVTPLLAILTAVVLGSVISQGGWMRWAAAGVAAALIIVQSTGLLYRIKQNTYSNLYLPAVAAIRANSNPADLVLGSSAFFWTLRGERRLSDDVRLGYYSHAQPELIVIGPFYRGLEAHSRGELQTYLQHTLALYRAVPFQGEYEILTHGRR